MEETREGYLRDKHGNEVKFSPICHGAPLFRKTTFDPLFICSNHNSKHDSGGRPGGGRIHGAQFFKELKEKSPELKKYTNVHIKSIIRRFNENLVEVMVEHRDGVVLPLRLGTMFIATFGKKKKTIDIQTSSEEGVIHYLNNSHSEGYGGGVYYSSQWNPDFYTYSKVTYANARFWSFETGENFCHRIKDAYVTNWKKYWVLPTSRRIIDLAESYKKKKRAKEIVKVAIEKKYNEFKF